MTQHRFIHMRSGAAKYSDLACFLGHPGPTDGFEPPTFVMIFDEAAPPREVWGGEDLDHVLIDVVAHRAPGWDRPQFVALSEEGAVVRMLPGADVVDDIPGAGLWKPGARKYGYCTAIRSLDARLHVIGLSGQCWREGPSGGWEAWDEGLLAPGPKPIDPVDIACSPEGDTFVCDRRYGRLWVRGAEGPWRELATPRGGGFWRWPPTRSVASGPLGRAARCFTAPRPRGSGRATPAAPGGRPPDTLRMPRRRPVPVGSGAAGEPQPCGDSPPHKPAAGDLAARDRG